MRWPPSPFQHAGFSLRGRLMLGAAVLAVLFMLALLPALQRAFSSTLEGVIEQRLMADSNTLITAAHIENGRLEMPERLPDEEFNLPDAKLLGYIYDSQGSLVWQSRSSEDESIDYRPRYEGGVTEFLRISDAEGVEYFAYDVELHLAGSSAAAYSFITMQPASEYHSMLHGLRKQLYLWLGGGLLVLLGLLWLGLTWSFRSWRRLGAELDEVESGQRAHLSDRHPRELLRLTRSLNRLLDGERRQRQRYHNALGDLAHSLKTPLTVLQSVAEVFVSKADSREQARVMLGQIDRMSQQIDYQLQRASLGKSGLVRYQVLLQPLLTSLCSTLDKVYHEKRVRVHIHLPERCTAPVEQGALMELLGNLLENAYRLCLGRVSISARVAGDLRICVEDDGPGVAIHQRERITRRGERLDVQHSGQGIGLAVVNDILASYDGELSVGDSPLGGAAFELRIPLD